MHAAANLDFDLRLTEVPLSLRVGAPTSGTNGTHRNTVIVEALLEYNI